MPIGHMLAVKNRLSEVGMYAEKLLDDYEERLAIICEGREVKPEDISVAWGNVLQLKDLIPRI